MPQTCFSNGNKLKFYKDWFLKKKQVTERSKLGSGHEEVWNISYVFPDSLVICEEKENRNNCVTEQAYKFVV